MRRTYLLLRITVLRTATPTFVILFVVCFLFVDHREKRRGIYPSFLRLGKRVFLLGGERSGVF